MENKEINFERVSDNLSKFSRYVLDKLNKDIRSLEEKSLAKQFDKKITQLLSD